MDYSKLADINEKFNTSDNENKLNSEAKLEELYQKLAEAQRIAEVAFAQYNDWSWVKYIMDLKEKLGRFIKENNRGDD